MPTIKDSSSIEEVLQYIVACYGVAIYQEKQRLSNLIADLYTGEERLKRLYRRMVMEDAVSQQLYAISLKPIQEREGFYNRLVFQFKETNFYEEAFARQVLDVFLHGMNLLLVEPISTKATKEDGEWYDEYGVKYSADRMKLIRAPENLYGNYRVLDGTVVICDDAFSGCRNLQEIILPSSVTSIGNGAFSSCTNLKEIILPSSITSIGGGTFSGCTNLKEINIPSGVTRIGSKAIVRCTNLQKIILPSSVTNIGNYAFAGCANLQEIILPSSITSIGNGIFSNCSNLQRINVAESNKFYKTIDGVLYTKDLKTIICYPEGKENGSFVIPLGVTSIGDRAFTDCKNLQEITLPSGLTSIGNSAFESCKNLCKITLPSSVTSIGDFAFRDCRYLQEITIPSSVTSIGDNIFGGFYTYWHENLKRINIPLGTFEKFKKLLPGWTHELHEV